jgi:hypothetical protein
MEFDNSTILYIVFAIGYFVFTNFIKKKKTAQNGPPSDRPEDATDTLGPPPGRRPSFEELLEEFTTGKPAQREAPIEIIPEKQEVQVATPSASFVKRKGILENHSYSEKKPEMERFGKFDDVQEETSKFTDILKEPDGAQKAFVLSEIFKKKF